MIEWDYPGTPQPDCAVVQLLLDAPMETRPEIAQEVATTRDSDMTPFLAVLYRAAREDEVFAAARLLTQRENRSAEDDARLALMSEHYYSSLSWERSVAIAQSVIDEFERAKVERDAVSNAFDEAWAGIVTNLGD